MAELHPTQSALVAAVVREFQRARDLLEPRLRAKSQPEFRDPEVRNIQYAQNTLRTCLEACLTQMTPYSHQTSAELAIRLASYAISIVPLADQEAVMQQVIATLPVAHRRRMMQGVAIQTGWQMQDGTSGPNLPGLGGRPYA